MMLARGIIIALEQDKFFQMDLEEQHSYSQGDLSMVSIWKQTILLATLTLSSTALASEKLALKFNGNLPFSVQKPLDLKMELKKQFPRKTLVNKYIDSVTVFAKSAMGNGTVKLKIGRFSSPAKTIGGPASFDSIYLQSPSTVVKASDDVQLQFVGMIKIAKVELEMSEASHIAPSPGARPRPRPRPAPRYADRIYVGDKVLEISGTWSLQTVSAIYGNGSYLLSNGSTYSSSQIKKLLSSLSGFFKGQKVLETSGTWSFQTIAEIAENGYFLLSNGSWYQASQLEKLIQSSAGFSVGQQVYEISGTWSQQTISQIASNGYFLLSNGSWYTKDQLKYFVNCLSGICVGEKVLETSGTWSLQSVSKIISNQYYLLSNGSWYTKSQLEKLYQCNQGFCQGERVLETSGTPSTQTISIVAGNGYFLLSNGSWYSSSQMQKIYSRTPGHVTYR